MNTILQAEHLIKDFGKERIINDISLEIGADTFTAILGPSGSGKSTLLNILSGLIRPTSGTVRCEGPGGPQTVSNRSEKELADWKRTTVGHVFQNYLLLNNLTVAENINIGINPDQEPLVFDRLTRMLEIDDLLDKFPARLSGGQQQRVAIARAVIKAPRLLFCDEATGALDETNSKKVVELLHLLKSTFGVTVLFVTHNAQIARTADRVLTIKNGLLADDITNSQPLAAAEMVWTV